MIVFKQTLISFPLRFIRKDDIGARIPQNISNRIGTHFLNYSARLQATFRPNRTVKQQKNGLKKSGLIGEAYDILWGASFVYL